MLHVELPHDPIIPLPACARKDWNQALEQDSVTPGPQQHYSQQPTGGTTPTCRTGDWMDKTLHAHTMKHCSAFKRSEILTYAAVQISLENITLSKIKHTHQGRHGVTLLPWAPSKGRLPEAGGLGSLEDTVWRAWNFPWDDKTVLRVNSGDGCTGNVPDVTELYTQNLLTWGVLLCVFHHNTKNQLRKLIHMQSVVKQ